MSDIYIVAEHLNGALTDVTFELLSHGKKLAGETGGTLTAVLIGGSSDMAGQLGAAGKVITVETGADFNPETYAAALQAVLSSGSPKATLVANSAMGMDLAATVAARADLPLAAYCHTISYAGGFTAVSQLYGGKIDVTSDLGDGACMAAMLAGSASAEAGRVSGSPATESVAMPEVAAKVRFKQLNMPEKGDVDITSKEVLVAIGRGIGSKDDIEVAEELAEALGAVVAASRPIIDAGWLPKSRQVGKSGLKVKPKVYLALGISGAPEHIEGMKESSIIIAINTDEHAPIFDVAHYGMVGDLFDICEELTDALG
ncbi:MAG: electron transfer flavoprotein subunit alpha/FixB family protein [Candidatus Marinimicrobia bacterium]|nr:electron transfer flavoprotein subunit alpha/FixB family protein [Candidatus Neomarinimicrobiota bacterium]